MMTEKGVLVAGVEYEGALHRDFEIRPQLVKDSVEALEENERAARNERYLGICVLARQITRLGGIPEAEITPSMIMDMNAADLVVISEALRRLAARVARFHGEKEGHNESGACAQEAGV